MRADVYHINLNCILLVTVLVPLFISSFVVLFLFCFYYYLNLFCCCCGFNSVRNKLLKWNEPSLSVLYLHGSVWAAWAGWECCHREFYPSGQSTAPERSPAHCPWGTEGTETKWPQGQLEDKTQMLLCNSVSLRLHCAVDWHVGKTDLPVYPMTENMFDGFASSKKMWESEAPVRR